MRLENVVAVTGGRLLNDPSISRFESAVLHPSKATRGSLFIAHETADIQEAISNGAYGIITDKKDVVVTDEEAAWIVVDSLDSALVKLLRLWLVSNPRKFHLVETVVMEFLRMSAADHRTLLLPKERREASEAILASKEEQTIFCEDRTLLEHIGAAVTPAPKSGVELRVLSDYLFESTFILDGAYKERAEVAGAMLPFFKEAIEILKGSKLGYTLSRLTYTPSFMPIFVDAYLRPLPFGSSEQVLIFCDSSLPKESFEYLNRIRWTESKLFLPTQIKFQCDIKMKTVTYKGEEELLDKLKVPLKPGYYIFAGIESGRFFDLVEKSTKKPETKGLF